MRQDKSQQAGLSMTRRRFLATAAAASVVLPTGLAAALPRRSAFAGVQVGAISYSFRALPTGAEDVLGYLVDLGLPTVELMGDTIERFAGAPTPPQRPRPFREELTEAESQAFEAARDEYTREALAWRKSAPMQKFAELRRMYNDAGVTIDIAKIGNPNWSDEEIDYAFNVARTLGARGISLEVSDESAERMGPFATKHKLHVGMHNHTQVGDPGFTFDKPLSFSRYNAINLDIGHYIAGTNQSPIPVLQKYADRITHLHLKDRKMNNGDNLPWGQGDTPIIEVLQLLKREQYPITAMIELEYEIPAGSDVLTEMKKCVAYCQNALV